MIIRHETNMDGNPLYFVESDDYVKSPEWGRRDPSNSANPLAYSVSFLPRERTILAYQGGQDVTEMVYLELPGLVYHHGAIVGDFQTAMRIVNYLS